jgi:putative Mg2+ transporter-C (MgtC) family protein
MIMSLELQAHIVVQLVFAALLSAIVGIERERTKHPAGLRTHMLVGVGSCLFTALSAHAFGSGDPGRVASYIVAGIGFLGAGTIVKGDDGVRNLTTAASIWVTAAIGMAVGADGWFIAIAATVLIWVVLSVLHKLDLDRQNEQKPQSSPKP